MSASKTIIVTGANRGIGLAICTSLLSHPILASAPLTLYAASRAGKDLGLKTVHSGQKLVYPKLDVVSQSTINDLVSTIKSSGGGTVDVLINNAGINLDKDFSPDNAKKTLDTNYRGTLAMCQAFIPLLSPHGRIVNVSSVGSKLIVDNAHYSKQNADRFRSISSLDELEQFMQEYQTEVNAGTHKKGFPDNMAYSVSKACINSFTSLLSKDLSQGQAINCCCPGWVQTEMGGIVGASPAKTTEEGARIPVRLALADIGGVSGNYWSNDQVSEKGEGKVQPW